MEINIVNTINGHQNEPWGKGCKSLEVTLQRIGLCDWCAAGAKTVG